MSASIAQALFAENMKLYQDHGEASERFILYKALWNLAKSINSIDRELQKIKQDINYLKVK